ANGTRTNAVTLHSVVMDCPDLCAALKQRWGLDPDAADSDGDGRSDGDEVTGARGFFSLPILADSNGNGLADGAEVARGLDPLDNHPAPPQVPPAKRSPPAAAILVAVGLLALAWRRR
ncbi:MAG: hypothetical protein LC623_05130, partial [Halobacteriales archaeon]|nr:hypothetical protein [Halobacteriales archaeon]